MMQVEFLPDGTRRYAWTEGGQSGTATTWPNVTILNGTIPPPDVFDAPLEEGPPPLPHQPEETPGDASQTSSYHGTFVGLPSLPWWKDVIVNDTLDSSRTSVTYKIPVGPWTRTITLTVNLPQHSSDSSSPLFDSLNLVDSTGHILSSVSSIYSGWEGRREDLEVAIIDAPVGSMLIITISLPDSLLATVPVSGSEPAPALNLPFVFEVQRQDVPSTLIGPVTASGNLQSPTYLVTLANANLTGNAPTRLATSSSAGAIGTVMLSYASSLDPAQASDLGAPARSTIDVDTTSQPIILGPLVSLGSTAMGPVLGTIPGSPTEFIDRTARIFDVALEKLDGEQFRSIFLWNRKPRNSRNDRLAGALESVPSLSPEETTGLILEQGAGGLPVLIPTLKGLGNTPTPEAMLATLSDPPRLVMDAATASDEMDGRSPSRVEKGVGDAALCGDSCLVTTAFASMASLGVTSIPLYPDMLTLFRRGRSWFGRERTRARRIRRFLGFAS